MRPLHLEIEGLRSFRAPVEIDFTDRDRIAIIGDTGAGKSSILEAMTWALYGQPSFKGRGGGELLNDTSTGMRVVFRFRVSEETWQATRGVKRRPGGDQSFAELIQIDDRGEELDRVEQVARVNERVTQLLGLDGGAFLRTVILPQGRFERLLVDPAKERSEVLRQVWRTDELEAAGRRAEIAWRESQELRTRLEARAEHWPEDPEAHLEGLRTRIAEAQRSASSAGKDASEAEKARGAMQAVQADAERAGEVRQRLGAIRMSVALERLAPLSERERDFERQAREGERRREALEAERTRIPSGDGPSSEEAAAARTTLPALEARIAAAGNSVAAWRSGVKAASEKRAEAERLGKRAAEAKRRSEERASRRPPLEEAAAAARARRAEVETRHQAAEALGAERREAGKHLGQLRETEAGFAARLAEAREQQSRTGREAAEAEERLAAARRSNSAAHAAAGLHAGDDCPVCRRELPEGWEAPEGAGLEAATRRMQETRAAATEAERQISRLDAELRSAGKRVAEAETAMGKAEARWADARRELAEVASLDADDAALPDRDALLAPFDAACERADAALGEHDREAGGLREEAVERDKQAGIGTSEAGGAEEAATAARQTASGRIDESLEALRAVPEPFRPKLSLPEDVDGFHEVDLRPIAAMAESVRAREAVLKARRRETERIEGELREAGRRATALAERRKVELEEPLREIERGLGRDRDALLKAADRLQLERDIALPDGAAAAGTLEAHARDLEAAAGEIGDAAEALGKRALAGEDAARKRARAVGERLGLAEFDPEAVWEAARERAEDARHVERAARREEERFVAVKDEVRRLRALLEQAEARERALGDLKDALKPGAFLKWLTLRRSRELLVHASRKLEEISGGRYAFADPGDGEVEWRILDQESGQPRSPRSLSGGEKFLASLALALGMVEMMERTGGRLESLFLDEGFGSLDAGNLEAAIDALETAAATRMVAVISHVRMVAERIDHILSVTREATGSQAVWRRPSDPVFRRLLE